MPKKTPKHTFEAILEAVRQFHDGVSLSSLIDYLEGSIPKRTLQRHLAELVQKKLLIVEGKTRGRKYKLPRQTIQEQDLEPQKKARSLYVLQLRRLNKRLRNPFKPENILVTIENFLIVTDLTLPIILALRQETDF